MELQHISHEHPLVFIEDRSRASEKRVARCSACKKFVGKGPSYCCSGCKFYLHKTCAELELSPEINHPFHPRHPLILKLESPSQRCNLCRRFISGHHYHCASCDFDLDIKCASIGGNSGKLQHPSHEHPFIFIQTHDRKIIADCLFCLERISSYPFYKCLDCLEVYLHKKCAELAIEISHPLHPPHPLILKRKSPDYPCNLCRRYILGFHYHCASCDFDLDTECASIGGNFGKLQHPLHEHPFIFFETHDRIIKANCLGCLKEISSDPFYKCLDCLEVYLHKKCADLPLEIDNFQDRHLLLLQKPPIHPESCSCYFCKKPWKGFVYCCHVCEFILTLEDVSSPPEKIITSKNHEHPWTLLSRHMSFICDFCGIVGDNIPYLCVACNFIVHKDCISLPNRLVITRHHHRLSHSYSLKKSPFEKCKCRICFKELNTGYGSYYCPVSSCSYIAHVNCATDPSIWDPTYEDNWLEGDTINWIIDVIHKEGLSRDETTTEIQHFFHNHNLVLTFSGEAKDDSNCDGCMRPISTPFYCCKHCKFFLHKSCAELPRRKRHPSHKHVLALSKDNIHSVEICYACYRVHHGFSYNCEEPYCSFKIDIQCSLLSDTLRHPSHKHQLFLGINCQGNCSGCREKIQTAFAYKCMEGCGEFMLEFNCITLPLKGWCKYDKHPLSLTYDAGSDPYQFYCDICEEERDSNKWFYSCAYCDTTVHPKCTLGDCPLVKIGRTYITLQTHPLNFNKNIWDCPPCIVCKKHCYGQALQCTRCKITIHWECRYPFTELQLKCVGVDPGVPSKIEDECSEGESMNWIIDVIQIKCLKGEEIVTKMKYAFHNHNLNLGEVKDNRNCDVCMKPISTPFYGCEECDFSLHKICAELPREKRHPTHKHLLALTKNEDIVTCDACQHLHRGFSYKCKTPNCYFEIDTQCSSLSDTLKHPIHQHSLFLDHNCQGNCIGCREEIQNSFAYKCTKGCDQVILDFRCLTLPQITRCKYHMHPLALTYHDADPDLDQFYCDICEEERDPNKWFYCCVDCYFFAHLECVLGELPFIKLDTTLKIDGHPHLLTFVKHIWTWPPCNVCKKLCYGQALHCAECNFYLHWRCVLLS